jgi:hypothetical protein
MWRRKLFYRQSNFLSSVAAMCGAFVCRCFFCYFFDSRQKVSKPGTDTSRLENYLSYIQGDSDEERLIFLKGFFLFPSGFTIVANAFTITFSADVFGEVILTSEGVLAIQCIYSTRQKTDNSFFIRFGSNGKLMI